MYMPFIHRDSSPKPGIDWNRNWGW